ncbi:MAG: HD domain-containing protein, partial [Stellaceae bacterium]
YDMYHTYTVDEHSLMAIGILHQIEAGELKDELPLATEVMATIDSRRVLYLATLLHDIAKGRAGDHSVIGAEIAARLAPRLGLRPDETEAVVWLVRWHLLMSNTAQRRDLDDERTIRNFVAEVQSPERLKLLLVLTVADIRAVGPKVWNGWKAALLRELFGQSLEMMAGGMVEEARSTRIAAAQTAVRALLGDFSDAEFEEFRTRPYPYYWLAFGPEEQARHARLMREADREAAPLTVKTRVDATLAVTEVVVYTADHPGLFSRLAAALALAGANIVDAKILTMSDGMALDSFLVQDREGGAFDHRDKLARLSVMFMHVLRGKLKPQVELAAPMGGIPSRNSVFTVLPRVLFDNIASANYTVMEVNGRDRPGLLYELTRAITALNLQISRAKISTYGEKVVDVFYVKDLFGHKVTDGRRLKQIRERLGDVLAGPPAAAEPNALPPRPRRARRSRAAAE